MIKKLWFFAIFIFHINAFLESFGNTMVGVPNFGITFLDASFIKNPKPWGVALQYYAGVSFMQAIDYNWWWLIETNIGFGKSKRENHPNISTLQAGSGVRYDFLNTDFRPFLNLELHYLHFLGEEAKNLPLDTSIPIWVGPKTALGLEWLFYEEMAVTLALSYGFYVNLSEPFRHTISSNLGYVIYF